MYLKVPKQIKLIQKRVTPLICFSIKEYFSVWVSFGILLRFSSSKISFGCSILEGVDRGCSD